MTEIYRDICFCQYYKLKTDVENLFDFFHIEKISPKREVSLKDVEQFLKPSVSFQERVDSVNVRLKFNVVFAPKPYLDRIKEFSTETKMTKSTKLFVQNEKKRVEKFLKKGAKIPSALCFTLHIREEQGSGFRSDVIPKILNYKTIKSNLNFLLKKVVHRSLYGYVCPDFQYDASKFKFLGEILSAQLPVPKPISSKLGKPNASGIELNFEDSPIGLEDVQISKENGQLVLALKIRRRVNNFRDVYPKVLSEAKEIAELLLESVT